MNFQTGCIHNWKLIICTDTNAEIMSDVKKYTRAAINGLMIRYDIQIKYLEKFGVIHENENSLLVTEVVLEAVKVWEETEKEFKDISPYDGLKEPVDL